MGAASSRQLRRQGDSIKKEVFLYMETVKKEKEQLSSLGVYEQGMEWNPVEKVIMERRSVRVFKKEPLPNGMIQRILEAGRFAPSAGNSQPWKFIVVNSPEIIAQMERDGVRMAKRIMFYLDHSKSLFRKIFMMPFTKIVIRLRRNDFHPAPFAMLKRIADGKAHLFHGAPTIILLLEDKRGVSNPPVDIGVCGQNMVLAAHSMGAASCWIGLIKLCMFYPKWRKLFGVKFPYKLTECIAFGWPKHKYDGEVSREVQIVEWFEGGINDSPIIVRQGE